MNKQVTRGVHSYMPGQLITLKFPGMMDTNFNPSRDTEAEQQALADDIASAPVYPAIVLAKHESTVGPPSYDVGFFTRGRSGGMTGLITITRLAVWRYLAGDPATGEEGTPPEWLVDSINLAIEEKYNLFECLDNMQLHYSKHIDSDTFERVYLEI